MNPQGYLGRAVQVVTFLFAAFSGYLKGIAPPEEGSAAFATGLASFLALVTFLLISTASRDKAPKKHRVIWLRVAVALAAVCVVSGLGYKHELDQLTFPYPPDSADAQFIGGTEPTQMARSYFDKGYSASQVVAKFGGPENKQLVWTQQSIRQAGMLLTVLYLTLVVSLAATIFSLTEIVLSKPVPPASPQNSPTASSSPVS